MTGVIVLGKTVLRRLTFSSSVDMEASVSYSYHDLTHRHGVGANVLCMFLGNSSRSKSKL